MSLYDPLALDSLSMAPSHFVMFVFTTLQDMLLLVLMPTSLSSTQFSQSYRELLLLLDQFNPEYSQG